MKAAAPPAPVDTATSVYHVQLGATLLKHAPKRLREDPTLIVANKSPRHFRGFLWEHNEPPATPLASLSESMSPLPPPSSELANAAAWSTIRSFPHLFAIKTPIKADVLEALLVDHPNQPLVASVCRGFREGFWPFVDASQLASFSETWDETNAPLDDKAALFPSPYAEVEERAGRYSAPFSGELLPGMYSMMPVRKPRTEKLRFNNNHSAGRFSLNSMMDKHAVGMRPDNVQDFVHNLLHFRRAHGMIHVILFKSDIANAYRLLPMHPLWQLKQVVTVNGLRRIDPVLLLWERWLAGPLLHVHGSSPLDCRERPQHPLAPRIHGRHFLL